MENTDKNIPNLVLSTVLDAKIIRGKHQASLPLAAVFFSILLSYHDAGDANFYTFSNMNI